MLPYQRHQRKQQANNRIQQSSFDFIKLLYNKPFWIFDKDQHLQKAIESKQNCCFNHVVSLPTKDGRCYPLFEYEKLLFNTLMYQSDSK